MAAPLFEVARTSSDFAFKVTRQEEARKREKKAKANCMYVRKLLADRGIFWTVQQAAHNRLLGVLLDGKQA